MPDPTIVGQLAEAVERQGGDLGDVRALIGAWRRLRGGVRGCAALARSGDARGAERVWQALECAYGYPLDTLAARQVEGGAHA